jgi:hypothetical protein
MIERVTVPSDFDCIEQIDPATWTIGRNPDLDAAIVWHIILGNGSCVYLYGVLFWCVCDIAEVLQHGFEEGEGAGVADGFFGLFEAAEVDEGLAAGFVGGHAGVEVFFDGQFEVGGHLGVEVLIELSAAEEGSDALKGLVEAVNGWTVSITRDGKTVRKQSLRVTQKSPTDESGYHMVRIGQ